jgi:Cu/Zn superoxide dismutase
MLKYLLLVFIISLCYSQIIQSAVCVFQPSTATTNYPNTAGYVQFDYDSNLNLTNITGFLTGFPPNTAHGFHVHIKGDMSAPDASSSGLHWNPLNNIHGGLYASGGGFNPNRRKPLLLT